jgi:putative membrane protein
MAVYTIAVDWFAEETFPAHMFKEFSAVSSSGIILGLLLVFRTNSAYERWWEGRKLWGQLVNDSRNICLKVRSIDGIRNTDKARLGELVISFAYALKHHLRGTKPSRPLPGVGVVSDVDAQNIPVHITGKIFELMQKWRRDGQVDGMLMLQFDRHALAFMDIAGGCERIKNSPIAISYRAFMRQGIALNLLAMPWYMSQSFSMWWCLPLVLTATYFLVGIELIAEDIEDPFGYDGDDLPLDNICAGIRLTVGQIMKFEDDSEYTRSMDLPRFDFLKGS